MDNKKFKHADLEPVKKLIAQKVEDGDLSDQDINDILESTRHLYKDTPLTRMDIEELCDTVSVELKFSAEQKGKVPILLRILGIITAVSWLISLPTIINSFSHVHSLLSDLHNVITTTTSLMIVFYILTAFICIVLSIVTGVLMFLNKRVWAGRFLFSSIGFTSLLLIFVTILEGVSENFYFTLVNVFIEALISIYLQPKLYKERRLHRLMRDLDTEERAKTGRLGLKVDQSKGYIELDFFNLFWIFIIGSIIGLIAEYVFHILFVWGFNPENWYDRAGLLFGPFSPIYGFGGLFMTLFLNRLRNLHPVPLFVFTTIIGGAFEYVVSWFLETAFGIEAWNYTGMFLSINGRTCLLFAAMFGVMGLVWIKWGLPQVMKLINMVPWKLRYPVTLACTIFMIINCVMTLQSIDCWSQRQAGKTPVTQIEKFYEKNYDDEFMSKRFASMSFQQDKSSRDNLDDLDDQ